MSSLPPLIDGLDAPWSHYTRTQGLVIAPEADTFADDGAGNVTIPPLIIISPLTGSWIRTVQKTFVLGTWDAVTIDIPPTAAPNDTVQEPLKVVWVDNGAPGRIYDNRDRIVLGQRIGSGRFKWRYAGAGDIRKIRIPIDLRMPRQTTLAGNSFQLFVPLTLIDMMIWGFAKDVLGALYGIVRVPKNAANPPNIRFVLDLSANATTGVTVMNVSTNGVSDGDSFNPGAWSGSADQYIIVPGTARQRESVVFPASGVWTDPYVADDLILVAITHVGTDALDTLAVTTELWGAYMECDVL